MSTIKLDTINMNFYRVAGLKEYAPGKFRKFTEDIHSFSAVSDRVEELREQNCAVTVREMKTVSRPVIV